MKREFKFRTAPATLDGTEGRVRAAFSVFDEIDEQGDIVRASAFTSGQAVPMVWSHDWDKPVGKGVVQVEAREAIFDGQFNLATTAGKDAYEAVKFAAELQEWSFGFRVTDSAMTTYGGQPAREILRAELFEVSPTLVGANRNTHTVGIKGETFDGQEERVRLDLEEYLARARSLADLRAKEGRAISAARRRRLEAMLDALTEHADELRALLEETAPKEDDQDDGGKSTTALLAEFLAIEARQMGVEV